MTADTADMIIVSTARVCRRVGVNPRRRLASVLVACVALAAARHTHASDLAPELCRNPPAADVAAVRSVLDTYIDATASADAERARPLFHPRALMSGEFKGRVGVGTPDAFFASLEGAAARPPTADGYIGRIQSLEICGMTATGAVVEERLFGLSFVDHFHLLKVDGRWLIVSKLYIGRAAAARDDSK